VFVVGEAVVDVVEVAYCLWVVFGCYGCFVDGGV